MLRPCFSQAAARWLSPSSVPRASGVRAMSTFLGKVNDDVNTLLSEIRAAGTYKKERIIVSDQSGSIRVKGLDKPVLNFCANNYLGLANHPKLIEAAKKAMDTHGFGLASVRFICGTQDIHKELEQKIAQFHGTADTILYPSCFDANAGFFEAVLTPDDAVLSDTLNHASIIDGIRLCKAQKHRYEHLNMNDLESKLKETQSARFRLIVTDGVFSMDGDVAPLKDICDLADKYHAFVFVDECHATGFFGRTGRGTPEHCGVMDRVDVINSTLGKALGGATGGYTTSHSRAIIDLLRQRSRPYLFSNTIAPPVVGASLKVLEMLMADSSAVERLQSNTAYFRKRLTDAGFTLGGKSHPIVPVMLGDARLASEFADEMLHHGIYVIGFSFPVVPKGQARIRTQLSAAHTREMVEQCIDAFISVGRKKGVIN